MAEVSSGSIREREPRNVSKELLVKMAKDYSAYFKIDIYASVSQLQEFLEEAAAKLDELSSLFEMNEEEMKDWTEQIMPAVTEAALKATTNVRERIDTFQELMEALKVILDKQEAQIVQAETAFGFSSSLLSVLKYFRKPETHDIILKQPFEAMSIDVSSYFTNDT